MAILPSLKPNELVKILKKCGFLEHHQTGSHLVLLNKETNTRAVVPMHNKTLKTGTLLGILKQANLTKEDLLK